MSFSNMNQTPPSSFKRSGSEPPMDEPPVTHILETTLESVTNDVDDDTHARWDNEVLENIKSSTINPDMYAYLLALIVDTSRGLLDPRYLRTLEAMELLEMYPELGDELTVAFTAKSFKEIRNLSTYNYALVASAVANK